MREIVFRGKTPEKSYKGSRWIFGDLFRTSDAEYDGVAIQYYDEEDGWMTENVIESTVGEHTSFYDTNGKPIYEGDILKCGNKKFEHIPYVVGFRFGLFEIRPNDQLLGSTPMKYHLTIDCKSILKGWTIIGNLHDNPEMLKGDDK